MDSDLPTQINALRQEQERIKDKLRELSEQCHQFDHKLESLPIEAENAANESYSNATKPSEPLLKEVVSFSSLQSDTSQVDPTNSPSSPDAPQQSPPPLPVSDPPPTPLSFSAESTSNSSCKIDNDQKKRIDPEVENKSTAGIRKQPTQAAKPQLGKGAGEWELNFGQVWLVRIGVVFLLTGLIFLSTYAYKNWLFYSGAGVKVAFFMTISMALTGTGLWLERWKNRLKQYGRVVAAGGLAAGDYTIYASHFTPSLKVISSPVLAGLLLTIWAGVMLAYAVWKKSRVVAVMAIGLAFYGTIINPAGWLALFSSLLLSSAGMWLLVKFRWIGIGLSTVIAAYVAHAFWLGYYPSPVDESVRFTYLACYWVLFSAALTVPQSRSLDLKIQRTLCAINNTGAWTLTVFLIPSFTPHPQIGWISLGIGAIWILIATSIHYNRNGKGWHPKLAVIFGYQGLLIFSLGILLVATGYTRFLIMAVEACVLLAGARYFGGTLSRIVSILTFICALITALPLNNLGHLPEWPAYAALALVSMAYTLLIRRDQELNPHFKNIPNILPAAVTWVILVWGVFGQWPIAIGINGLWLTATSVMLGYFLLKRPWWLADLAIPSMFVALGGGFWFLCHVESFTVVESIAPILCAAVYWLMSPELTRATDQVMTKHPREENLGNTSLEWVFSLLFWEMLGWCIHSEVTPSQWLMIGGILAIAGHALAQVTDRRSIAIPALFFHGVALAYLIEIWGIHSTLSWAPALLILCHLALADTVWPVLNQKGMRIVLSTLLLLSLLGSFAFRDLGRPDLVLTALGLFIIAWAYIRNDRAFAATGSIPAFVIACLIAIMKHRAGDWVRYVPLLTMMLVHGFLWVRKSEPDLWQKLRIILLTVALLNLFVLSSAHVTASFNGSGLSICWALMAMVLFGIGLLMHCRPYRLVGLLWLGAAVLHVIGVDVMRLGSLGRILSFITLGVVLLILGFLYNRFQDTIRKFL